MNVEGSKVVAWCVLSLIFILSRLIYRLHDRFTDFWRFWCRYEALRAWNKCLISPDAEYWTQLRPGTVVGGLVPHQ